MYCTPADVRAALIPGGGEDVGPNGTAASMEDEALEDAIQEADRRIDTYVSRQYPVPLPTNPDGTYPAIVRDLSRDIAQYLATLTYRRGRDLDSSRAAVLRYKDAMDILVAINAGRIQLDLNDDELPDPDAPSTLGAAGAPMNPYTGTLFGSAPFDLGPSHGGASYGPFWIDP